MRGLDKQNMKNCDINEHDDDTEASRMLVTDSYEESYIRDDGNDLDEEIRKEPAQLSTERDSRKNEETLWIRLKNDKFIRTKYILTTAYIVSFLTLGWVEGQFGPTFPELRVIAQITLEKGSFFFTMVTVGYVLGSVLMGYLFDRQTLNRDLMVFLATSGYGVVIAIVPWCGIYEVMLIIHVIKGAFGGALDTCGNAGMVMVWGTEGDAYFSALHFSFALGGILSPLATAPYLKSRDGSVNSTAMNRIKDLSNSTIPSYSDVDSTLDIKNLSNLSSNQTSSGDETSTVYIPYTMTTGLCILTSLPFFVFCCMSFQKTLEIEKAKEEVENRRKTQKRLRILGFINMVIYIAVYFAVENSFEGFLTTFVMSELHWTNSQGSYITSGHWAAFATGRFLAIFIVGFFRPRKMIFTFNAMMLISLLGFLIVSFHNVTIGVWIFTLTTGFSMSVIFPTVFMWTEQTFLRVTGKIASIFLVAASVGSMINPPLLAVLMETFSPMWFGYILFGETVALFLLYFVGLYVSRKISSLESLEADAELAVSNDDTEAHKE
ncbi:sodium-dependent glucose transporter 1A-like [Ostrea edulis]|uniref:sodium-dependent glucose transporter 1A-like n=1 Tax=Ostrea edulis TaxID=37623 RepID=UPI0024AECDCF|nr:sodium-dependent glucose transporter 1A-like [Ostrea edulis]